jgi:hypothetical protein
MACRVATKYDTEALNTELQSSLALYILGPELPAPKLFPPFKAGLRMRLEQRGCRSFIYVCYGDLPDVVRLLNIGTVLAQAVGHVILV